MAKVRLGLASVLLLIPVTRLYGLSGVKHKRGCRRALRLTGATFFLSVIVFILISREFNPPWLSFASSSLDVTLVSGASDALPFSE